MDVSRILSRSGSTHVGLGGDGHSSTRAVADTLLHATRSHPPDEGHPPMWIENCLRLHAVGFTEPAPSPKRRCALTAPFHPCLCHAIVTIGGLLSVALALTQQSKVGGRYPPPCPVVSGLSSRFARIETRDRLSTQILYAMGTLHA